MLLLVGFSSRVALRLGRLPWVYAAHACVTHLQLPNMIPIQVGSRYGFPT